MGGAFGKNVVEDVVEDVVEYVVEDVIADNLGVLKLTDFGFAKETHTRDTLQTPCYTPYYVGKFSH